MDAKAISLEEFISAVLRGAAKILGCGSTNLILINEKTQEMRVRLGTMAASYPILAEIEQILGSSFKGISFPIKGAEDSLIYQSFKERAIRETSLLAELVGSAIPEQTISELARMIGEHRFVCVPALSRSRNYGVLLFQKEGKHPFNRQQCEVLLRYARRIGEILEDDLMGQGQTLFSQLPGTGPEHLLFDQAGQLLGQNSHPHELSSSRGRADWLSKLGHAAQLFLADRATQPEKVKDTSHFILRREPTLQATLTPFLLGQRPSVLATLHWHPERAELSLENQLLQLTLGDSPPALFVDADFLVTSCNDTTELLSGYAAAELVGQPLARLFDRPQEIEALLSQQILDPDHPYSEESTFIVQRDGSIVPVHVEALLLADDMNQMVGFLVLIRKSAETSPQDTARLMQKERLATMGELTAQLAHEIRNPLVAIGATLESLISQEEPPSSWSEQRGILAAMSKEIARLDMTLKDYLAARHDLAFVEVTLAEVINDARRLLEGAHRLDGKRVLSTIDPTLIVWADYDAIKHVFFNLLLNALEASPAAGQVTCRSVSNERNVSVFIEDEGPGLSASPEECFQPFFTTKQNGTGLGLAVCQKITQAHGGLILLRDRDGGGAQAVAVFPHRGRPTEGPA